MTALDLKSRVSDWRRLLRRGRRKRIIIVSCVALALCYPVFEWLKTRATAPVPKASVPGGYYEADFTLELTAPPYGQIYYTTDGSTPTENSQPSPMCTTASGTWSWIGRISPLTRSR